jgi:GTP cyclohydrolase I
VAKAIEMAVSPLGVAVILEAEHMCMTILGVKKETATTQTYTYRGAFKTNFEIRRELF